METLKSILNLCISLSVYLINTESSAQHYLLSPYVVPFKCQYIAKVLYIKSHSTHNGLGYRDTLKITFKKASNCSSFLLETGIIPLDP